MSKQNDATWRVEITRNCERQIESLERIDKERIFFAFLTLTRSGTHRQNVRQVDERPEWVMRVGGWRIILRTDADNKKIVVLNIGRKPKPTG